MTTSRLSCVLALAVAAIALGAVSDAAARQKPSLSRVMAKTGEYVKAYAENLSAVVGREEYEQIVEEQLGAGPLTGTTRTSSNRCVLVSEFALIHVSGNDSGWEGLRDVFEVNGTPVRDRQDRLEHLFADSPSGALQQARIIAEESARFNIGPIVRNFNVPTSVLFFLHPTNQRRFRFAHAGDEDVNGRAAWIVTFDERDRPTLIRTPDNTSVPSKGRAWIEPDSGRVLRTELQVARFIASADRSTATVSVEYALDPRLDLLVPSHMREQYVVDATTTVCVATYSNFRKFATDARIIVPKRQSQGVAIRTPAAAISSPSRDRPAS